MEKETVAPVLQVKDIKKSFAHNAVLKGISLELGQGEIFALVGGNGAGKSTLMKIIMGLQTHDEGCIYMNGKRAAFKNPADALAAGIYMVPQEPLIFPNMTVEENILIGIKEKTAHLRVKLAEKLQETGFKLHLQSKASSLSIAEQELVEILRGLMRETKMMIFDEPTSALTFDEVKSLFRCIKHLQSRGIAMFYITHRLNEVFEIATHVAIMRDGIIALQGEVANFNHESLLSGLLPEGTDLTEYTKQKKTTQTLSYSELEPALKLENFSGLGFSGLNLEVYPGEILGVAGVVGAGRTEFATTIFGRDKVLGGKVFLNGKDITGLKTSEVIHAGLNYVPEDRHLHGLFKMRDVAANTTASIMFKKSMGRFFLNTGYELKTSLQYVQKFRTKVTGLNQEVGSLSGGNQQKVVLGRTLATEPTVIILDEPTRGIDAPARNDAYQIIQQLKAQGVGIMLISSDMEEIVELADRAVAVHQGRIVASFSRDEITDDNLMAAAFGIAKNENVEQKDAEN